MEDRADAVMPEKLQQLVELFAASPRQIKIEAMVDYSNRLPDLPAHLAEPGALERVHECQTPFFVATTVDPDTQVVRLYFDVPLESPTMRGYAGILADGLEGATVDEVMAVPDTFYLGMGIEEVVSALRIRGMGAILARIKQQLATGGSVPVEAQ
jgi:cysteine desulfuration protein SufE